MFFLVVNVWAATNLTFGLKLWRNFNQQWNELNKELRFLNLNIHIIKFHLSVWMKPSSIHLPPRILLSLFLVDVIFSSIAIFHNNSLCFGEINKRKQILSTHCVCVYVCISINGEWRYYAMWVYFYCCRVATAAVFCSFFLFLHSSNFFLLLFIIVVDGFAAKVVVSRHCIYNIYTAKWYIYIIHTLVIVYKKRMPHVLYSEWLSV